MLQWERPLFCLFLSGRFTQVLLYLPRVFGQKDFNSVRLDLTASIGAIWSQSTLFAYSITIFYTPRPFIKLTSSNFKKIVEIRYPDINPLYTNGLIFMVCYNRLGIVHCTYLGVSGYNFNTFFVFIVWRSFLPWQTVLTLIKCQSMRHFIWVFTVCKSTCLGVAWIQRGIFWSYGSFHTVLLHMLICHYFLCPISRPHF